jgi:hypothetical protein
MSCVREGQTRVARFCSTDHQEMASKKALEGNLYVWRHKDIC